MKSQQLLFISPSRKMEIKPFHFAHPPIVFHLQITCSKRSLFFFFFLPLVVVPACRLFLFNIFAHKGLRISAGNRNRAMRHKSKNNLNVITGKYLRLISRNPRIKAHNKTLAASLERQEISNFKLRGNIKAVGRGCAQK